MKTTGTQYWNSPNQGATNESGFSGLPGGWRDYGGGFGNEGSGGDWWSSSAYGANALCLYLNSSAGSSRGTGDKHSGYSVRCLRD